MLEQIETKIGTIYADFQKDNVKFYDSDKRFICEENEKTLGYFEKEGILDSYINMTERDLDFFFAIKYARSIEELAEKLDIPVSYLEEEYEIYRVGKYYFAK